MGQWDDHYDFDWLPGFKEMTACQEEKEPEKESPLLPPEELEPDAAAGGERGLGCG